MTLVSWGWINRMRLIAPHRREKGPRSVFSGADGSSRCLACRVERTGSRAAVPAGHGAGRSTDQVIGENADLLSFALFEMGFKNLKK